MKLLLSRENNLIWKGLLNWKLKAKLNLAMMVKMIIPTRGAEALKFRKLNALLRNMKRWWKWENLDPPKNQRIMTSQEAQILSRPMQSLMSWLESHEMKAKTQDSCRGLRWWLNQKKQKLINQVGHQLSREVNQRKSRNQGLKLLRVANQKIKIQRKQKQNNQNRNLSEALEATMPAEQMRLNRRLQRTLGSKRAIV